MLSGQRARPQQCTPAGMLLCQRLSLMVGVPLWFVHPWHAFSHPLLSISSSQHLLPSESKAQNRSSWGQCLKKAGEENLCHKPLFSLFFLSLQKRRKGVCTETNRRHWNINVCLQGNCSKLQLFLFDCDLREHFVKICHFSYFLKLRHADGCLLHACVLVSELYLEQYRQN